MADSLTASIRDQLGSRNTRRLRSQGQTPAVLYGHGGGTVHLSLPSDDVATAIRHGSKLLALEGGVNENALIREVQWDALGGDILHLDLARVAEGETVEVAVVVELRGEAPGAKVGGHVQHLVHELQVQCPATEIPDKLYATINSLELGQSVKVGDIELPPGSTVALDPTTVVVQCIEVAEVTDDELAVPTDGAEPEVIGKKDADAGDGE